MKQTTLSNTSLATPNEVFLFKTRAFQLSILLLILSSLLNSCNKKQETPNWETSTTSKQDKPNSTPEKVEQPKQKPAENNQSTLSTNTHSTPLRFVCYNIRNYLTMRRGKTDKFKPEHEVKALIDNIIRAKPDILGICEIGTQKDLNHLLNHLKKAGLNYQHSHLAGGPDPYRRQALISHYPISPHNIPKYTYMMKEKSHEVRRGILDATVSTPKGDIRLLGAHLKSKRPIPIYDQAEIRREEAQILRKHASVVLSDQTRKVIVFGDMNDTKGSSTIRLMRGSKDHKLTAIELFDNQGTKWTQYWSREDIYSRFDFIFVSNSLLPHIDKKGSYILDTPPGCPASDHRALVILIN